jgi:hypothetical protein
MTSPEKPEFVLFMIPTCQFCNNFLMKLKPKTELIKKFNIVDINKLPVIPDEVEEVPCVYDGKQIYQGTNSFKWLNEKLSEYLLPANDGLSYSFINGNEELIFNGYSLLEQKNGSFGMGNNPEDSISGDPTRMNEISDNSNKNRTLDSLVAARSSDLQSFNSK